MGRTPFLCIRTEEKSIMLRSSVWARLNHSWLVSGLASNDVSTQLSSKEPLFLFLNSS